MRMIHASHQSICTKYEISEEYIISYSFYIYLYLFHTFVYFGLSKDPPGVGPPGILARPASGRQGSFGSPKYDTNMKQV